MKQIYTTLRYLDIHGDGDKEFIETGNYYTSMKAAKKEVTWHLNRHPQSVIEIIPLCVQNLKDATKRWKKL